MNTLITANKLVAQYGLLPHPEGGYYKETYRSSGSFEDRSHSTAIYYLLESGQFSSLHRIKSDEVWHFYEGASILIHEITSDGAYKKYKLGNQLRD